jgi:hypothetical protein
MVTVLVATLGLMAFLFSAPTFGQVFVMSGEDLFKHCSRISGPAPIPEIQRLNNTARLEIWLGGADLGYCHGYIEGVADASANGRNFCIPVGTTAAQFGAVAIQYLREHPALRQGNAAGIVSEALHIAYPRR